MPPYIAPERGAAVGFWGLPTSTLDWCEENYATTHYIAEFWNAVSSVAMMAVPGVVGLWAGRRYGLEQRYLLCYLWLVVVGMGSFLFHGTLTYSMQLLDELPMLMLAALMLFALYEMGQASGVKTTQTYLGFALLMAYVVIVSLVYLFVNDPTFHEVAYGILVLGVTVQGFYCLKKYNSCKYLLPSVLSLSIYVLGFIVWNIDNHFCPHMRGLRKSSPLLGNVSQLHAWWHAGAGLGTYFHLLVSSRIRMEYLKKNCTFKVLCGLPYLAVTSKQE